MNVVKAESTIVLMAGVTFASVATDQVTKGHVPSGRQVAATCLAFAGLGAVAGWAPDIAGGLALTVGGTAFVTKGLPVLLHYFPNNKKNYGTPKNPKTAQQLMQLPRLTPKPQ